MPEVLENDQIDRTHAFTFNFELRVFDSEVRRRLEENYTVVLLSCILRYTHCYRGGIVSA